LAQERVISISGKVISTDNEPLFGVNVYLEGTNYGTTTNFNGEYTIKNIKPKTHTIVVSFVGFVTQKKQLNPEIRTYNFKLREESNVIDEVTIRAKTKFEKIETEGFSVESIDLVKIKSQSLEINQVLDNSPGIRVRTTGGVGSDYEYRLNGMSGSAIKFFIDEIPMDYYGSSYSINNIPIGLIERVDVYKGVVPIELGSDALGGSINLVTKQNIDNFFEASTSVGSFYTLQSSINGQWKFKSGFTTKLSAFSTTSENNYKVWGRGVNYADESTGKAIEFTKENPAERFNDDFKTVTGKVDIGFTNKKWADQFFVGVLASDLKKGVQTGQTISKVYGKARNNSKTLMPNLTYKKNDFLTKGLNVNAFGGYTAYQGVFIDTTTVLYDWRGYEGAQTDGETSGDGKTILTLKDKSQVYRLNTSYNLPLNFKLGVNYLYEANKRSGEEEFPNPEREQFTLPQNLAKQFAGLSIETKQFSNKLNFNAFVKYFSYNATINNLDYTETDIIIPENNQLDRWGAGFATSYQISPNLLFQVSLENGVRMPSPTEALGDGVNILGNAFIEPEESFNVNLGFVLGRYLLGKDALKIVVNGFYRDTDNKILLNTTASNTKGKFENVRKISGQGVELDITYDFGKNLSFNLNGTYTDLRNNLEFYEDGTQNILFGDRMKNEPYLMANAGIEYNVRDFLQKDSKFFSYLSSSYVHEFFLRWPSLAAIGNSSVVPTQLVFDAGMGYSFPSKKLTLAFDISNILNEQVYDNFLLQKPGRAFFLKATYDFIKK